MAKIGVNSNATGFTMSDLFGRTVLRTSLEENELTPENIKTVLELILPIHFRNAQQIDYLYGYYRGNQDILNKVKLVREDINNKVVENSAYHIVEFKKSYVFGSPIQYVQNGLDWKDEIDKIDLAEDRYITGTSYRMIFPEKSETTPFVIYNANPKDTAIVYSNDYKNTPLFAFYITTKNDYSQNKVYYILTVYTKKRIYTYKTKMMDSGTQLKIDFVPETIENNTINWLGYIPIIEYPLNKSRMGLIELVKSSLDTLNKISSNDIDGIEQFIQSLLIFMNLDIDTTQFKEMVAAGAVKLKTIADSPNSKADIKSIVNQLQHSETKILYDRVYNNMLTIAGVPKMTDKSSSGDTGQARLIGEGWIMADERAKQDELSFKLSEKQMLNIAINICKNKNFTGIKQLNISDMEIKFTRNKSDNLLVKAQALINLMTAQVAPEVAFNVIGLFSDSNEVVNQSKAYFGEDFWKKEEVKANLNTDDTNKVVSQ